MDSMYDLNGALTIEGPLLEMAYAALCIKKGEDVVARQETLGIYHDVFIKGSKGHIFCECDGQGEISREKVTLFRDEVLKLNSLLIANEQLPITEARFVVMLPRSLWGDEINRIMEEVEREFSDSSIRLNIVEPKRLLYDLVSTSIIGFMLIDNHIILAGPGHWAIRYNASVSRFEFGDSTVDLEKFRRLPQSFIARDYWNERHKDVYAEYVKISEESLPEWFSWKFPDNFGVTWNSPEQIASAVLKAYSRNGRIIAHRGKNGFVSLRKLKKNSYYTANIVYKGDIIGDRDIPRIENDLMNLVDEYRSTGQMQEDLDIYLRMFTDTVTFSHMYWIRAEYRTHHGEPYYTEIHRGDDVLVETLNSGDLGLKLDRNRIMFSMEEGPNSLTLVRGSLQWESSVEGTYPATLKF